MARRTRATSPFLPTPTEREKLPSRSALARALRALPDPMTRIVGPMSGKDVPIEVDGVRNELSEDQITDALEKMAFLKEHEINAFAENSRRSMRSDWRHWIAYCAQERRVAMPIALKDACHFIDALIAAGYKRATLEHLIFTLTKACQIWSCPSPFEDLLWKDFWRDRCRDDLEKDQYQAPAMNVEDLRTLIAAMDADDPRSIRDTAFVAVSYNLMARASELVAMEWASITFDFDQEGSANFRMGKSKTDLHGKGTDMHLWPETAALLLAWKAHSFEECPFVFHALPRYKGQPLDRTKPLNVRQVSRILERLVVRSGLDKQLSGHSSRVGAAQDMTRAGQSLPEIMQAGRWKSPQMPARYAEKEIAARAGRARRVALDKLSEK